MTMPAPRPSLVSPADIGLRIAASRKARGWTQSQLAGRADVDTSQIARWEIAYRDRLLSLPNLVRVARALEVTTDSLLFGPAVSPIKGSASVSTSRQGGRVAHVETGAVIEQGASPGCVSMSGSVPLLRRSSTGPDLLHECLCPMHGFAAASDSDEAHSAS